MSLKDADFSEIERRILREMPADVIVFDERTAQDKADAFAYAYGGHPAMVGRNYMFILRGDDTQSPRHGGIRQYRSFTAYVNGIAVESWRDDEQRHDYSSASYLDQAIDRWVATWEKALGCKAVRGEIKSRVRLIPEPRR